MYLRLSSILTNFPINSDSTRSLESILDETRIIFEVNKTKQQLQLASESCMFQLTNLYPQLRTRKYEAHYDLESAKQSFDTIFFIYHPYIYHMRYISITYRIYLKNYIYIIFFLFALPFTWILWYLVISYILGIIYLFF